MSQLDQLKAKLYTLDPKATVTFNNQTSLYTCRVVVDGDVFDESSPNEMQAIYLILRRFRDRLEK